jgi:hypothetical protein
VNFADFASKLNADEAAVPKSHLRKRPETTANRLAERLGIIL